MAPNEAGNI